MKMIFKFACAVFFFAFATLIVTMQFLDKQWFIDPSEDRKARIGGIIATLVACGAGMRISKKARHFDITGRGIPTVLVVGAPLRLK
jgi:hypothetical protein